MKQISSAVSYLQGWGIIHSNISSHCILMRHIPSFCVKLSSFELATEKADPKLINEIQEIYTEQSCSISNDIKDISEYILRLRNQQKNIRDKYRYQTQEKCRIRIYDNDDHPIDLSKIQRKHLSYYTMYRRKFSLHYYQAPEILKSQDLFVFPTFAADVYSLSLLLWEITNNCIPYVIYNEFELEKLYSTQKVQLHNNLLPNIGNHRIIHFGNLLKFGLQVIPSKRITLNQFVLLLASLQNELSNIGLYTDDDDFLKARLRKNDSYQGLAEYSNIGLPVDKKLIKEGIYDKTEHNFLNASNVHGKLK